MSSLADRVEREGAGRELDRDIAIATFIGREEGGCRERAREVILSHGAQPWNYEVVAISGVSLHTPPTYTASIDAALQLVPEGWRYSVAGPNDAEASVWPADGEPGGLRAFASTPAQALCAAALRARAQEQNDDR